MARPRKSEEEKRKNRCPCGAMISRAYVAQHRKKQKHLDALEFVNSLKQEHNVCPPVKQEVEIKVN